MDQLYFIVNPVSGSGKARLHFDEVRAELDRRGIACNFDLTTGKSHATLLAKAALARGCRRIISVGGDGTANEVAAAMINSGAVMGILPFGTGNDIARALGLATEPLAALETVLTGREACIDAAMANDTPFLNVAGTGFDVDVIIYTEKFKRRFNGMLPYMLGVMQSLLHLKPFTLTITADGKTTLERALLFNACNGTHFAGGMNLAPLASVNDGLLDVCILRAVSIPAFLLLLPRYINGRHLNSSHIRYFKARSVHVESDVENTLNIDGELGSHTPVTFKVLPGALSVLMPRKDV